MLAKQFALAAHSGQWYGTQPYRYHLNEVVKLVGDGGTLEAIAWLHDTLEDCVGQTLNGHVVSYETLVQLFGKLIADCVLALTDPLLETETNKFNRLANAPIEAKVVKLADLAANMVESIDHQPEPTFLQDYVDECDFYFRALGSADYKYLAKRRELMRTISDVCIRFRTSVLITEIDRFTGKPKHKFVDKGVSYLEQRRD